MTTELRHHNLELVAKTDELTNQLFQASKEKAILEEELTQTKKQVRTSKFEQQILQQKFQQVLLQNDHYKRATMQAVDQYMNRLKGELNVILGSEQRLHGDKVIVI